jgi:hypothetical protein
MYEVIITTKNGIVTETIEDIRELSNLIEKYWDIYISVNLKRIEVKNRKLTL